MRWTFRGLLLLPFALLATLPRPADAIPAFARKYSVSCSMCHAPVPRLSAFGQAFAANGFEFAPGEPPRDTVQTGDPLLRLMREVPLAMRVDLYAGAVTDATSVQVPFDLQTPWLIKLLSGGQLADRVSYYMYFFLTERGEVAGLEDAYIQLTQPAGLPLTVAVGQFQVSDPLFRRELRLEYEDYVPYRVKLGDASADLTYERGVMASVTPWGGGDVTAAVVNGAGLAPAGAGRQYDGDHPKNGFLRVAQEVGPVRIGGFGYYGWEKAGGATDRIAMWGPDVSARLTPKLQLNAQYLRRQDDNPLFQATSPGTVTADAAFAELVWLPRGQAGRLAFTGLWNWASASAPIMSVGLGEAELLGRYQSLAAGANYLLRRNLRLTGEAAWVDAGQRQARFVLGIVAGF